MAGFVQLIPSMSSNEANSRSNFTRYRPFWLPRMTKAAWTPSNFQLFVKKLIRISSCNIWMFYRGGAASPAWDPQARPDPGA